jgi:hypothetical protein
VAGSSERENKHSFSLRAGEFIGFLSDCWLLEKAVLHGIS